MFIYIFHYSLNFGSYDSSIDYPRNAYKLLKRKKKTLPTIDESRCLKTKNWSWTTRPSTLLRLRAHMRLDRNLFVKSIENSYDSWNVQKFQKFEGKPVRINQTFHRKSRDPYKFGQRFCIIASRDKSDQGLMSNTWSCFSNHQPHKMMILWIPFIRSLIFFL